MSAETRRRNLGLTWREFVVGDRYLTLRRTIFESELNQFLALAGLQEMLFTDLTYISRRGDGRRLVPGSLVLSMAEGLSIQALLQHTGLAFLEADWKVRAPAYANDTIEVEIEVIEQRATSKGDRGLVRTRNIVRNQDGLVVAEYTPLRLVAGSHEANP
ncbi:MAG: acyl dehydratase [Hyphomicrobiaceae bacterium]